MKTYKLLIILFLSSWTLIYPQNPNDNTNFGAIKIDLPKSPETTSFEKYGKIPVNESSGTISLAFPLMTIKGRQLEVPISLSYLASGIKVSQESTWVGLGFDIISGGRISVETKGNIDDKLRGTTNLYRFKSGLKKIFDSRGTHSNSPMLGYGFIDYGNIVGSTNTCQYPLTGSNVWDDYFVITNSAWYGVSEPDIYHANFMGQNIDFYISLTTDSICLLNEKSNHKIEIQRDSNQMINEFDIIDNDGIIYKFKQKEKTTVAVNNNYGVLSYHTSTSAWLLNEIIHPLRDTITFTYSNYGKIYPMFNWSASKTMTLPNNVQELSITSTNDNQLEIEPYYLSKIESANARIDFILESRNDIRGSGARKLKEIKLIDKNSNILINNVLFNYDYFVGNSEPGDSSLPSNYTSYAKQRLKLLSVRLGSEEQSPTYNFFYDERFIPGKLSYSQDHWGYFNDATNRASIDSQGKTTPHNLIPTFASLGGLISRNIGESVIGTNPQSISTLFDGLGIRTCNPGTCTTLMLDSIVYPTGGSSVFTFEPHHSYYRDKGINEFIGGGIRIKTIKTYKNQNSIDNIIEYKYELNNSGLTSGIYLGSINYMKIINKSSNSSYYYFTGDPIVILGSNGDINSDNQTVGYNRVKIIYKYNNSQKENGYTIKQFYYNQPYQAKYDNYYVPFCANQCSSGTITYSWNLDGTKYLLKQWSNTAPSPNTLLEGKIFKEEQFTSEDKLVQSIDYYYHQAEYSENFYSLKVEDNYNNSFGQLRINIGDNGGGVYCNNVCAFGYLRWALTFYPAKSFYTLTDSIITKNYNESGNYIKQKQSFKYNSKYQPIYEIYENSDKSLKLSYTKRILDYGNLYGTSSGEPTRDILELSKLLSAHMINTPIEQLDMLVKPNSNDTLIVSGIYYKFSNKKISTIYKTRLSSSLKLNQQFTPSFINGSQGPSIDKTYFLDSKVAYNDYMQINQIQKMDSTYISYLWGYNYQYPVAQIIGSNYVTAASKISQNILNHPGSDSILQNELNKLRSIPNSLVNSYTYSPFRGVTSITQPNSTKEVYTYDNLGRLITAKNNQGKIISNYKYQFQSTPDNGMEGYAVLNANIAILEPKVIVDSTVTAIATTTGGSNDFDYNWHIYDSQDNLIQSSVDTKGSTFSFSNSTLGSYYISCVITDKKTRQTVNPIYYFVVSSLLNVSITTQFYSGNAGHSSVTVTGGSGNYTYNWYLKDHSDNILSKSENSTLNYWNFGTSYVGPVTLSCRIHDNIKNIETVVYYDFTSHN